MTQPTPRFEIDDAEIELLVKRFYARIRKHDVLGPIFNDAIGTGKEAWVHHEEKIARFWKSAIFKERSYFGNPMHVHMANDTIQAAHFKPWLDLFHEVAAETLQPEQATAIGALADRIGEGLAFGVANHRKPQDAPPILR